MNGAASFHVFMLSRRGSRSSCFYSCWNFEKTTFAPPYTVLAIRIAVSSDLPDILASVNASSWESISRKLDQIFFVVSFSLSLFLFYRRPVTEAREKEKRQSPLKRESVVAIHRRGEKLLTLRETLCLCVCRLEADVTEPRIKLARERERVARRNPWNVRREPD